jgi:hypothetical protein
MQDKRLALHEKLCEILDSRNAYFNPPEDIRMKYPAIRYKLSGIPTTFANNNPYLQNQDYNLILIDYDPDSPLVKKILSLPYCKFDRHYTASNLNHWSFTITI